MAFETVLSATPQAAAEACGARLQSIISEAVAERGIANIAVSGGTTPKLLFQYLAAQDANWDNVHLFWVDERAVPPGDPQSNFTLAQENWLNPAGFPASNVHRIRAELPVMEAAERYADEIANHFELAEGQLPVFDAIQQGMGADAHTASLFPGEECISDRTGVAAAVYVDKLKAARITLLPGVLIAARNTLMLVTGADKAEALRTVWNAAAPPSEAPACLTWEHSGEVTWFLDDAAAAGIL